MAWPSTQDPCNETGSSPWDHQRNVTLPCEFIRNPFYFYNFLELSNYKWWMRKEQCRTYIVISRYILYAEQGGREQGGSWQGGRWQGGRWQWGRGDWGKNPFCTRGAIIHIMFPIIICYCPTLIISLKCLHTFFWLPNGFT